MTKEEIELKINDDIKQIMNSDQFFMDKVKAYQKLISIGCGNNNRLYNVNYKELLAIKYGRATFEFSEYTNYTNFILYYRRKEIKSILK